MARFKSILGKIEGRIGNTSLYTTKDGQQVIRKKPSSRKPSSEAQEAWETAFATTMEARRLFVPAIHYGFPGGAKGYAKGVQGFVQANVGKAFTAERLHPEEEFRRRKKKPKVFVGRTDYAAVQVAAGRLETPAVEVEAAEGAVRFRWTGIGLEAYGRYRDDRLYGLAVCPESARWTFGELGTRGTGGEHTMPLPRESEGKTVWAYVFATTADGRDASGSKAYQVGMNDEG